jgi:glucose-6-phosphate 1-epimerase
MIKEGNSYRLISNDYGAQVTSAIIGGRELLYLSPCSIQSAPARGGVPVLFPQFASNGLLKKHGFARQLHWTKTAEEYSPHGHRITHSLFIRPDDHSDWPHAALLELESFVSVDGFTQTLKVTNAGLTPFEWTGGLHPYFVVDDICRASIRGLSQVKHYDCHNPGTQYLESDLLHFDNGPCEKIFDAAPSLCIHNSNSTISLSTKGFTQWMIWNPGKKHGLGDLPTDAWGSFICIEPVIVSSPKKLLPGEVFMGEMRVVLL